MREVGDVAVTQKEHVIEWKINDFASLSGIYYYSQPFDCLDLSWNFGIQPYGSEYTATKKYIDLFIYRRTDEGPPINIEISISLKNLHQKTELKKYYRNNFKRFSSYDILKFLLRADFDARQSEFLASGSLTIVCTIRRLTSPGTSSDTTVACSYCTESFDAEEISFHEKKCRIKCPDCDALVICSDWLGHECLIPTAEGESSTEDS